MNFLSLGTQYFRKLVTVALFDEAHQIFGEDQDLCAVKCTLNSASFQCVIVEIADKSKQTHAIVREIVKHRQGFVIVGIVKDSDKHWNFAVQAGVDIVVPESIGLAELRLSLLSAARISANQLSNYIQVDGLIVDLSRRRVEYNDREIVLSKREFQVLEMLALSLGVPVTKERLLDQVYGLDDAPASKIIDVFICKLRKKLAAAGWNVSHIKTYWGEGYSLNVVSHDAKAVTT